ncbi:hypothetical protein MtrunA17_Chr4g0071981 [Medicago truncatula]|uniref:Uncharacterized protein n=1 Tax=Medicago truncatula TaxID=3880 RepID=A0A396IK34_MEDTR|nr:hypothetical protein MtrunA17_Chr4g0071981 [Medicago truncatula]
MVWSDDNIQQLEATKQIRRLLSTVTVDFLISPIEQVIQSAVVPRFVEFLFRDDLPQLQFEATSALSNIVAGTSKNTKVVIDHGEQYQCLSS